MQINSTDTHLHFNFIFFTQNAFPYWKTKTLQIRLKSFLHVVPSLVLQSNTVTSEKYACVWMFVHTCIHVCVYMCVCVCLLSLTYAFTCMCTERMDFPGRSDGKESASNAGDPGSVPGVGKVPWRRVWQPTPVLLPGKSHGRRSLVGYLLSMQSHRVWHDWETNTHVLIEVSELCFSFSI